MGEDALDNTLAWWTLLRSVAVFNVLAWGLAAGWLWRWRDRWPPDAWTNRRCQLALSAGYVIGCGYRSIWPVFDVQRLVMVDSFLSSVLVGRPWVALWCAAGAAYVMYVGFVDVPMYWARWAADEASGRHYLTLAQGLVDVSVRWVVSHQWAHWRGEVVWMTAYFSVAVWLSIALALAPRRVALRLTRRPERCPA